MRQCIEADDICRHEPVLPGGDEIARAPRGMDARAAAWAAGAAFVLGAMV